MFRNTQGMRGVMCLVLLASSVAIAITLNSSGGGRSVWEKVAFRAGEEERMEAPFHVPRWNPMALFGSPTGRTLSNLLASTANKTEHLGAGENGEPYRTLPAMWIDNLARGISLHGHVHASEHDHDCEHEHGHGHGHEFSAAERRWAMRKRNLQLESAYLLDPANLAALEAMVFLTVGSNEFTSIEWQGVVCKVPERLVRSMRLCRFSLGHYDCESGWWPEQSLYAAKTLEMLWVLTGQVSKMANDNEWPSQAGVMEV